jgi:hypothetical protein
MVRTTTTLLTYMIPPAFPEIWEPVSEGDFKEFKDDTE